MSTDSILRMAKRFTTSALGHGAFIAFGVLFPLGSVPALTGTHALRTHAARIAAPLIYDAAKHL
jgi:hypothetical protein